MIRRHRRVASFGIAVVLPAAAAAAAPTIPTVILSNLAGPTSDVPGMAGAKFNPGTTSSSAFDRPYVSPDGSRWIVGGIIDGSVDLDALIVGTGDTSAGATVPVKEGDPVPGDASLVYSAIKTQVGINNAGAFAFAADTSAPTGFDDVVARWDGSSFDLVAREGTQAPGQPVGGSDPLLGLHLFSVRSLSAAVAFLMDPLSVRPAGCAILRAKSY